MHIPKHFEIARQETLHALMREHPLATVIVNDASGLAADHLPLLFKPSVGVQGELWGHVARANPLWRKANGIECLVVFQGLQHYISPNGYATKAETGKVVPTWNYQAVHVQGRAHAIDDADWLRRVVTELTDTHEAEQSRPWQVGDAPDDYIAQMLKAIVGIRIEITGIVGKAKLSQNQSAENQASLIQTLESKDDAGSVAMAEAIRRHLAQV